MHHQKLLRRKWLGVCAGLALMAAGSVWAQVDALASIKQKGKIVVGVKADYKPFGYTDPAGKILGLEIDLAYDIAKRLGDRSSWFPWWRRTGWSLSSRAGSTG